MEPGVCFPMLLLGIDSERDAALRVSGSLGLREFLGIDLHLRMQDHSTISRMRRRISLETHGQEFGRVLRRLGEVGLALGRSSTRRCCSLARRYGQAYRRFVAALARDSGVGTPTLAQLASFDLKRNGKGLLSKDWESPTDEDARVARMKDGTTDLA